MRRRDIEQLVNEELARAQAPMVNVELRGDCAGSKCPTVRGRAKLDTGAAHTFVAPSAIRKLKLRRLGSAVVRGLGGDGREVSRYAAKIGVSGMPAAPVLREGVRSYPALDRRGDVALVGRDVLAGGDNPSAGLRLEYDAVSGEVVLRPSVHAKKKQKKQKKGRGSK